MKLFKSVDERLADIGFKRVTEDELGLVITPVYERYESSFNYTHVLEFHRKLGREPIVVSYEKGGDNIVGLTKTELKLALKKMKEL